MLNRVERALIEASFSLFSSAIKEAAAGDLCLILYYVETKLFLLLSHNSVFSSMINFKINYRLRFSEMLCQKGAPPFLSVK